MTRIRGSQATLTGLPCVRPPTTVQRSVILDSRDELSFCFVRGSEHLLDYRKALQALCELLCALCMQDIAADH